jgi:hypothetical protein
MFKCALLLTGNLFPLPTIGGRMKLNATVSPATVFNCGSAGLRALSPGAKRIHALQ